MSRIIKSYAINVDEKNIFSLDSPNKLKDYSSKEGSSDKESREKSENTEKISSSMLKQASLEAESIINSARDKANMIIMEAKNNSMQEVQQMFDYAKTDGYDEGYSQGLAEAEIIKNKATAELEAGKADLEKQRQQLEPEVIDLINNILKKIFNDVAVINPQLILYLVRQGLREATVAGNINIKVSQLDYDVVVQTKDDILSLVDGTVNIEIIKDLSLKQLDCVIETPFGNIDCSLGQQLESLKKNLYFILKNG